MKFVVHVVAFLKFVEMKCGGWHHKTGWIPVLTQKKGCLRPTGVRRVALDLRRKPGSHRPSGQIGWRNTSWAENSKMGGIFFDSNSTVPASKYEFYQLRRPVVKKKPRPKIRNPDPEKLRA